MRSRRILTRLLFLIIFIFLLNYLAMQFYWYSSVWYLDMFMHFIGGFWVALFILWLFKIESFNWKNIFLILFTVLLVGLFWELFEFLIDKFITQRSFNFLDTISDLFFDVFGGLFAVWYFIKQIKKNSSLGNFF